MTLKVGELLKQLRGVPRDYQVTVVGSRVTTKPPVVNSNARNEGRTNRWSDAQNAALRSCALLGWSAEKILAAINANAKFPRTANAALIKLVRLKDQSTDDIERALLDAVAEGMMKLKHREKYQKRKAKLTAKKGSK